MVSGYAWVVNTPINQYNIIIIRLWTTTRLTKMRSPSPLAQLPVRVRIRVVKRMNIVPCQWLIKRPREKTSFTIIMAMIHWQKLVLLLLVKKFDDLQLSASICSSYFITSRLGRARCTLDRFLIVGPVGSGLVCNVEISKRFHPTSSSLSTQLLVVIVLLVLLHTNKSL